MCENLTGERPLPSLNALRAFEAMGRTGSATRAAAELHVTHGAVSRQVKALEAATGVRLFEGPRHALRLTARGRALLDGLTPGFDAIAAAVRAVAPDATVRLAVHPSLAVKWLIPRLARFERAHPDISVTLSELPLEASRVRGADMAIRYLSAEKADTLQGVEVLGANRIALVCSPSLAADLASATRLTARTHPQGWTDWAKAIGQAAPIGPTRILAHVHYVLDAALAGLGAAVLPRTLVQDDLEAGRLAAPFGFVEDGGVLAAIPARPMLTRDERAVLGWLKVEANA
ncbi:LysR substrate-binding domain-containing protein [Brevundimonas lutea]|uniref:LysR substrate-binding domain-containing protein n=1 Tax=Brevundimonas lutea TaxID=2293980 RepID=UPI001F0BB10D|nr:LysR substrate-binding domain-containing protein [Brevundimonas lutea]